MEPLTRGRVVWIAVLLLAVPVFQLAMVFSCGVLPAW